MRWSSTAWRSFQLSQGTFGPAGETLADAVGTGTSTALAQTIEDALEIALERTTTAAALVVSPMYPMRPGDRARVAELLLAARE